jgi:hypothetical protein
MFNGWLLQVILNRRWPASLIYIGVCFIVSFGLIIMSISWFILRIEINKIKSEIDMKQLSNKGFGSSLVRLRKFLMFLWIFCVPVIGYCMYTIVVFFINMEDLFFVSTEAGWVKYTNIYKVNGDQGCITSFYIEFMY